MHTKVQDLTIEELRTIISDSIKDVMGDLIEDIAALSSKEYISSIEEARRDYKEGRTKKFEEVIDV
jgi:hypothetical protein